jgi:hypothetical protein
LSDLDLINLKYNVKILSIKKIFGIVELRNTIKYKIKNTNVLIPITPTFSKPNVYLSFRKRVVTCWWLLLLFAIKSKYTETQLQSSLINTEALVLGTLFEKASVL